MTMINKRITKIIKERFYELLEDEKFSHVGFVRTNFHNLTNPVIVFKN